MSDNCHLQALFSSPRNTSNPKVAYSYTPQFSTGDDGKLYKLASEGDRNKFFVLSDAEVEEELRVSQEMADTLRTINPKKPPKSASKTVKLGTSNRTTKIEKRAWEKKLAAVDKTTEGGDDKGPEMSSEETMLQSVADLQKKYAANLSVIERLISEKVQLEEKVKDLQKQLRQSKKLNKFQSAQQFKKHKTEQLVNGNATIPSVDALKAYYTQNLDLIENLYAQQKSTEVKLVNYLNELTEIKKEKQSNEKPAPSSLSSSPSLDSVLSTVSENNDKYLRNLTLIEQLFAERKSLKAEAESYKSKFYSLKRTTAMNENGSSSEGQEQGQSGVKSRASQEGFNHTAPAALQKLAVDNIILADVDDAPGNNDNDGEEEENPPTFVDEDDQQGEEIEDVGKGASSISMGTPSGGSNVRNVMNLKDLKRSTSPSLKRKKDPYMDKIRESKEKYFEKKKLAMDREQQEKLEQEMYEYELEQKRLRASKTKRKVVHGKDGKEIVGVVPEGMRGMAERDKLMAQRKAERDVKKKEKDDAIAQTKEKQAKEELDKVKRLTESIARSRQKEEEAKKKAKEEKGEGDEDKKGASKEDKTGVVARPKPTLSPEEITAKLQKQQNAWDAKIAKEKEQQKAKFKQTKQDQAVNHMLERQKERDAKLREKHQQKEQEAKAAAELDAKKEAKRREALHKQTKLNGETAKENAVKAKLEETLRLEEAEQKAAKKKKKKDGQGKVEGGTAGAPKYKNAADLIRTMTRAAPKQSKTEANNNKEDDDKNSPEDEEAQLD